MFAYASEKAVSAVSYMRCSKSRMVGNVEIIEVSPDSDVVYGFKHNNSFKTLQMLLELLNLLTRMPKTLRLKDLSLTSKELNSSLFLIIQKI